MKRYLFLNILLFGVVMIAAPLMAGCGGGAVSIPPTTATQVMTTPPTTAPPTTTPPTTTPPTTTITVTPPSEFSLISPKANSLQNSFMPELTWEEAAGADSYNIEVATSRSFGDSTIISQTGIKETSYQVTEKLTGVEVYYWRVTAVNEGGQTLCSNAPSWFCTELYLELSADARGLAISEDGAKLIVVYEQTPGMYFIISLEKGPIVTSAGPIKDNPKWVKVAGHFAIAYSDSGWLSIIDLSNSTVRYCAVPSYNPYRNNYALTPDGNTLIYDDIWWFPGDTAEHLYFINLTTLEVTRGPAFGESAEVINITAMAVTPDGKTAIAATFQGYLLFIDISTGLRSSMSLGTGPGTYWRDVKITPDGKTAVVTTDDSVLLVDIAASQIVAEIEISGLSDIDIFPDGKHIVAAAEYRVLIISVESGAVTTEYEAVNFNPRVVVTPDGKKAIILKSNNPFISKNNMLYYVPLEQP